MNYSHKNKLFNSFLLLNHHHHNNSKSSILSRIPTTTKTQITTSSNLYRHFHNNTSLLSLSLPNNQKLLKNTITTTTNTTTTITKENDKIVIDYPPTEEFDSYSNSLLLDAVSQDLDQSSNTMMTNNFSKGQENKLNSPTLKHLKEKNDKLKLTDKLTNTSVWQKVSNPKEFEIKTGLLDTSVWKMTVVVKMLKGMTVDQAINQLTFHKRKPAKHVLDRLKQLQAYCDRTVEESMSQKMDTENGDGGLHNQLYDRDGSMVEPIDKSRLEIVQTWVLKGSSFKDLRIHGRGRGGKMSHPSTYAKFLIRVVPEGIPMSKKLDGPRNWSEFESIWARLKRNKLDVPFVEKGRIPVYRPPWSKLPYRFLDDKHIEP